MAGLTTRPSLLQGVVDDPLPLHLPDLVVQHPDVVLDVGGQLLELTRIRVKQGSPPGGPYVQTEW